MLRRATCVLALAFAGCFADPPVVGESTSLGTGPDDSSSTAATSTDGTDPTSTSSPTSGGESTTSVGTTLVPMTSGGSTFGESTTVTSGESGMPLCGCGWTLASRRRMGGAYECLTDGAGGADPLGASPIACPKTVAPNSPCMTAGILLEGCCDPMGNVLFCPDDNAGTMVQVIDCSMNPPTCG